MIKRVFCSTIIPTVGRETITRAVNSVLQQQFDAAPFEVIVVNDSGKPLPDMAWQHAANVRLLHTNRRERSVARNTGAAVSGGKFLHFLDDDDLMLPGAMAAFWEASQQSDAIWLYGSYQTVDNHGQLVEVIRPEESGNIFGLTIVGESIPFQASLLLADAFYEAGMFDSDPRIIGVEDRDVGRRLAKKGTVKNVSHRVAEIRIGEQGSTTDWKSIGRKDQWGREKALNLDGAYASARVYIDSPVMAGRLIRAYLASAAWNIRYRKFFTAMSRLTAIIGNLSPRMLSLSFWRGVRQ